MTVTPLVMSRGLTPSLPTQRYFPSGWGAIREDGTPFPGEEHPAMVALRTGQTVTNRVMGVFNPRTNRYRWLLVSATPQFRSGERTPYQAFASFSDITELKRVEEELRQSERRTGSIVDAIPVGMHMYRLEQDGRLIFVGANPAADRILGVDHRMFFGKTLEEAFPSIKDTEVPQRYRDVARSGKAWQTVNIEYQDERVKGAFEVHAFQSAPNSVVAAFAYLLSGGEYDLDDAVPFALQKGTCTKGPLEIGEDCWLGAGAKVLDGASLGNRCVIGAGAVVNKPVPANSIAVGVPAHVVKTRKAAE
jgi:PAS domain-containing protein